MNFISLPKLPQMKKYLVAILMVYTCNCFSQANPYENAWKSLNENKRSEAEQFLQKAMDDPSLFEDAYHYRPLS